MPRKNGREDHRRRVGVAPASMRPRPDAAEKPEIDSGRAWVQTRLQ